MKEKKLRLSKEYTSNTITEANFPNRKEEDAY